MQPQTAIVDRVEDLTTHEQKNLVALLHELLNTAYDAGEGYDTAARAVRDRELADLFRSCAEDRRDMVVKLRELLAILGVQAGPHPTIGAEAHRVLIALRGLMEKGDATSILAECERGEHVALGRYERALRQKMPINVASVLLDQAALVRSSHAAFERMRHPW
jgi:uncharacterized protein (TIGR02284 family)